MLRHNQITGIYLMLVVVLTATLTSCRPETSAAMTCDDVLHPALQAVPFDDLDASTAEGWIMVHFPDAVPSPNGPYDFSWSYEGRGFHTHFDSLYRWVAQYPSDQPQVAPELVEQEPVVADVLRCFGPPDLYAVRDIPSEITQVEFSMWYLERGMIFQTGGNKSLLSNKYYPDSKLEGPFIVVPPGSVEQMFTSAWTKDPQYLNALLAELKPWPKDFRSVE